MGEHPPDGHRVSPAVPPASPSPGSPDGALIEPARQRLVSLAADVLGRLTVEQTPASLRSIARFTPAKRIRLGGPALSSALDCDERFRAAVADVVVHSLPDLAGAVRRGGSTSASDPLDAAVVAYLMRADGWEQAVSAAGARWFAERDEHRASLADAELARLREEVAHLRAQLKADAAAARSALETSTASLQAEFGEVRRQLRIRTGDLRAAERAREHAQAAADEALAQLADVRAVHEGELRRLRARIVDAERAAESARRGTRTERDVDDARLWLLIDTVTKAARGIERELSLAAPVVRPADTVASAQAGELGAGELRVADSGALERLLALPNVHLVVDGYNVTKTGYGHLALVDQRTRLASASSTLSGRSGAEITIAFDGGDRPPVQPAVPRGVRVPFSRSDEIADDLIRRLVAAEPAGRPVVVASSDAAVAMDVRKLGAWSVPSAVLLQLLG